MALANELKEKKREPNKLALFRSGIVREDLSQNVAHRHEQAHIAFHGQLAGHTGGWRGQVTKRDLCKGILVSGQDEIGTFDDKPGFAVHWAKIHLTEFPCGRCSVFRHLVFP